MKIISLIGFISGLLSIMGLVINTALALSSGVYIDMYGRLTFFVVVIFMTVVNYAVYKES